MLDACGIILFRKDGAALLQHRDNKPGLRAANQWVFPGGHRDPGESLLECAFREFEEETEVRCRDLRFLLSLSNVYWSDNKELMVHFFWDWYDGSPIVCHEGQALEFVHREQVIGLDCPGYVLGVWDLAWSAALSTLR